MEEKQSRFTALPFPELQELIHDLTQLSAQGGTFMNPADHFSTVPQVGP